MTNDFHPVLSCREAVALEKGLLQGEKEREWQAMSRAGLALAEALSQDFCEVADLPERPRFLILAGKGHNAGDAFIAVREILGKRPAAVVDVLFVMGEGALNPLAQQAWSSLLHAAGGRAKVRCLGLDREGDVIDQLKRQCGGHYHICLDGLFGMNFRPPFRPPLDEVVGWVNAELKADLRAAVDLPSGLSDNAAQVVFRADFTYMTGSAKKPLFAMKNAETVGRLRYLDIGFFEEKPEEKPKRSVILPRVLGPVRRLRGSMTHKRKYGHLLIVGGSRQMPGAILMSIQAAARSGVGLLTAVVPESLVPSFSAVVPEAMWIGCPETDDGGLDLDGLHWMERGLAKATAVLLGPGVGVEPETQALLDELMKNVKVPLVVDAEALQLQMVKRLGGRAEMRGKAAITPHLGEYERITGKSFADVGEEGLLEFCRETGLVTLLKGPPFTRLCDGETVAYGLAGGPVLARGGSGDILSGMVGSLVAQTPERVAEAAAKAMTWHGLAAEALARRYGQVAVRTTQLLDFLPRVPRELGPE